MAARFGEDADHVGAPANLAVEALLWVVGPDLGGAQLGRSPGLGRRLAPAAGALAFFAVLSALAQAARHPEQVLVGAAALAFLVWLSRRAGRALAAGERAGGEAVPQAGAPPPWPQS